MLLSVELNSDFYCVLSKGLDGLRRQKLGLNDRYVDSNVGITDRYEWLLLAGQRPICILWQSLTTL